MGSNDAAVLFLVHDCICYFRVRHCRYRLSFGESLQCVAGILGNVGLAFGKLGPQGSFAVLHPMAKIICVIDMLLGRLELFTLLVLLHPDFWQGYFLKRRKRSYKVLQPVGTHRRG